MAEITHEEALKATAALREANKDPATVRNMWFEPKKGQVLEAINQIHRLRQGDICMIFKESPDYAVYVHQEKGMEYVTYRPSKKVFKPANDQQINDFFKVEAAIEEDKSNGPDSNINEGSNDSGLDAGEEGTDEASRDNSTTENEQLGENGPVSEDSSGSGQDDNDNVASDVSESTDT